MKINKISTFSLIGNTATTISRTIVLFLFLLFSIGILSAQCPQNTGDCEDTNWIPRTIQVNIGNKGQQCPVQVSYLTKYCLSLGWIISEIQVSAYVAPGDPDQHDCTSFIGELLSISTQDAQTQSDFFRELYLDLSVYAMENEFDIELQKNPDNYYCPDGTFDVSSFYLGSCTSFCVILSNEGAYEINPVFCGDKCCKLARLYCKDPVTGEFEYEEHSTGVNTNCQTDFPTAPPCPELDEGDVLLFSTVCLTICGN